MALGNLEAIDRVIKRLETYEVEMNEFVMTIYASPEFEDLMTRLNEEQLQKGLRSDGSVITPPYSPKTVAIKKKKNQPVDRVTLRDYGDFYNGMRLKLYPGKMEIVSQDSKSEDLQDKYKPEILGFSKEAVEKGRQYILPLLRRHSNTYLLLR